MKRLFCLAALVIAFVSHASAATFRLIAINSSLNEVFYQPAPGREAVPLTIRKSPSKDYPCPAGPALEIFRLIPPPPDAPPGTPPVKQIVTSARLGTNESSLVILTPAGADTFTAFVVPDDAATHPIGTLRVINLSNRRIGVALDDVIAELDAQTSRLLQVTSGKQTFKLRLAHNGNGKWDAFWDQSLLSYNEVRSFAFIYDAPGATDPQVKLRSERPPGFWKKSAPAP